MLRSAEEVSAGILERIPESAPEREILRQRFDEIMREIGPDQNSLPFTSPEMLQGYDGLRIQGFCNACTETIGDPSGSEWKLAVASYLSSGS
ncbi:MAG: hypothetical protein H6760_03395 [Candidatus Nomurabacteria bacterium]|nr:MAG: hypothetical protein H6760_03395 [Candidatus Nomurabacteria bacterium]